MKLKPALIGLAVSASFGMAGTASAALELPVSGNGSLIFVAWDITSTRDSFRGYSRDLGFRLNDFLPSSIPALPDDGSPAGTRTPSTGTTVAFAADPLFQQTFAGATASNIRWNIFGGDSDDLFVSGSGTLRMVITGSTAPTGSNSALGTSLANGDTFITGLNNNGNGGAGCQPSCNDISPALLGFGGNADQWGSRLGQALPVGNDTTATGFGSTNFYYLAETGPNSGGTAAQAFSVTQFANKADTAQWTLSSDGSLVYALLAEPIEPAPIPLPAAAWLLLAGLGGLMGVGRKRNS